jgi:hypothetical protein
VVALAAGEEEDAHAHETLAEPVAIDVAVVEFDALGRDTDGNVEQLDGTAKGTLTAQGFVELVAGGVEGAVEGKAGGGTHGAQDGKVQHRGWRRQSSGCRNLAGIII